MIRKEVLVFLLLAVGIFYYSCFVHESTSVDVREVEVLILKYTNIERKNHNVSELIWDENLAEIAREHSEDMAENGSWGHVNLRGEGPDERALRHGYETYKDLSEWRGEGWFSEGLGENIIINSLGNREGYGYIDDADSLAESQVLSLMDSPEHRKNMLDPFYDNLGVGVAFDGTNYISTLNFW